VIITQQLPNGTQRITVLATTSEPLQDHDHGKGAAKGKIIDNKNDYPENNKDDRKDGDGGSANVFQITVPVSEDKTRLSVDHLTIQGTGQAAPGEFLEVRSSLDGYHKVIARISVVDGLANYSLGLNLRSNAGPVTFQVSAVGPPENSSAFDFSQVSVSGILSPVGKSSGKSNSNDKDKVVSKFLAFPPVAR
jgi:hypothetical protein